MDTQNHSQDDFDQYADGSGFFSEEIDPTYIRDALSTAAVVHDSAKVKDQEWNRTKRDFVADEALIEIFVAAYQSMFGDPVISKQLNWTEFASNPEERACIERLLAEQERQGMVVNAEGHLVRLDVAGVEYVEQNGLVPEELIARQREIRARKETQPGDSTR